jgi:hypothetical protein
LRGLMVIDYLIFRRDWERSALSGCAELLPFSLLLFWICSEAGYLVSSEPLVSLRVASARPAASCACSSFSLLLCTEIFSFPILSWR